MDSRRLGGFAIGPIVVINEWVPIIERELKSLCVVFLSIELFELKHWVLWTQIRELNLVILYLIIFIDSTRYCTISIYILFKTILFLHMYQNCTLGFNFYINIHKESRSQILYLTRSNHFLKSLIIVRIHGVHIEHWVWNLYPNSIS